MIIGIIGCTGAGKSTVAAWLAQQGFAVINGDALARVAVQPGAPLLRQLAARFGSAVLLPDGSLARDRLAAKAFANETERRRLNELLFPVITTLARQHIAELQAGEPPPRAIFVDAAALLESELAHDCQAFLRVVAPEAERLRRIQQRDAITKAAAQQRIAAQRQMQLAPPPNRPCLTITNSQKETRLAVQIKAALQALVPDS